MNTTKNIILNCMLTNEYYFDVIDDFQNVSKYILDCLKFKGEYSIETLIFKYFYLSWFYNRMYSQISWYNFSTKMKYAPTGKFRSNEDELCCDDIFILESYFENDIDTFNISYNILHTMKKERIYIFEIIIIVKFLRKLKFSKK